MVVNLACLATWVISLVAVTPLISFVKFDPNQAKCWLDWQDDVDELTGCQPLSNITTIINNNELENELNNITVNITNTQPIDPIGWDMFFGISGDKTTELGRMSGVNRCDCKMQSSYKMVD